MKNMKMKALSTFIVSLLTLSIVAVAWPVNAAPTTFYVNPSESIQAAIDSANPGDTVIVHAGTYNEKVVIEKQLNLIGEDAVIDLAGITFPEDPYNWGNAGVFVDAGGVVVSGFTIENVPFYPKNIPAWIGLPFAFGIRFNGSYVGGLIENNEIISDYYGIGVTGGISGVVVQNNYVLASMPILGFNSPNLIITNNQIEATRDFYDFPGTCAGIYIPGNFDFSGVIISSNNIVSGMVGPWELGIGVGARATNVIIDNNEITAYDGIRIIKESTDTVITNNEMHIINNAIQVDSVNPEIRNNLISNPATNYGIILNEASNAIVSDNEVQANSHGIQVNGGSNVMIQNNIVSATTGIWLADAPGLIVQGNTISATTKYAEGVFVTAISPGGFSGGLIKDNVISSDNKGIFIMSDSLIACPSNIEVRSNTVTKSINGIEANYAPGVIIADNLVYETDVDPDMGFGFGIILGLGYSGGSVKNNEVYAVDTGIQLGGEPDGPENIEIVNNNVYASNFGIYLDAGSNIVIKANLIYSSAEGLFLRNGLGAIIKDNEIHTESRGIWMTPMEVLTNPVLTNNLIFSAKTGILLVGVSEAQVKNNEIHIETSVYPKGGITIIGSINSQFTNNIITGEIDSGISLLNSAGVTSTTNKITRNDITGVLKDGDSGIHLFPGTTENKVTKNKIANVNVLIIDEGTDNIIKP